MHHCVTLGTLTVAEWKTLGCSDALGSDLEQDRSHGVAALNDEQPGQNQPFVLAPSEKRQSMLRQCLV